VAVLASDAIGEIERAGALIGRNIQRMASQAARRGVGTRQSHDLGDPRSNRIGEIRKCVRVFIAHHPGAVLVLQYRVQIARLDTAVASGGAARARSGVFPRLGAIGGHQASARQERAQKQFYARYLFHWIEYLDRLSKP
jgi:hypothetical protein